jgi:hypothetical protein
VLSLLGIVVLGGVVLFLRFAQPEQLARPEGFQNLVEFIIVLRAPAHPLLPSEWTASMLMNWLVMLKSTVTPVGAAEKPMESIPAPPSKTTLLRVLKNVSLPFEPRMRSTSFSITSPLAKPVPRPSPKVVLSTSMLTPVGESW